MTTFTWNDAFHELWMHAAKHRGVATSYGEPGLAGFGTFEVWPRTRGSDVLAIAAVVDPAVRALPAEPSGHTIEQRWRDCASDLARFAFEQPDREYAQNRTFWAMLGATAAYLATFEAPVPAELWRALFAEIARSGRLRNGAPAASTDKAVEDLPERIASAAGLTAHAFGDLAYEIGAGLLARLGTWLLVGSGVLLGRLVLLGHRDPREAA